MIPATAEKEKALIDSLRRGSASAKRAYYEQFYRYLAAVCARYVPSDEDVKDLLQEVFIKIFNRFDSFEHRGPGSLQAWSRKVAVNEALQFLRNARKMPLTPLDESVELPAPDEHPDVSDIPRHALLEMVRRLPERYRTVFNLFVFEDKSHKEIASLLGIKENSSASQLFHAKALLARWIKDYIKLKDNG